MMIVALSTRDPRFTIVKQAGVIEDFIGGAASTMKGKLEIRSKPFETVIGTLGPFLFSKSIIGWGLWELAKYLGFDLFSWVGSMADKLLGFGDPQNLPKLSKSNLESASEEASGQIWDKVKESLPIASLLSSHNGTIVKEAKVARWRKFLTQMRSGGRLSIVNVIYKILSVVAIALLGSAAFGGLAGTMGLGPGSTERELDSDRTDVGAPVARQTQHYANIHGDVESSLIEYMNSVVHKNIAADGTEYNFEQGFEMLTGRPLKGSKEMRKILNEISAMYYNKPIEELNKRESFYGPKVAILVQRLMPKLKRTGPKPVVPQVAPKRTKKDPKQELKQLLKGVFND